MDPIRRYLGGDAEACYRQMMDDFLGRGLVRTEGLDEATTRLVLDPQTSGGLLLGVPAAHRSAFERACATHRVRSWRVGEVTGGEGVLVSA